MVSMSAEFYGEKVCQWSRRGDNSPYKCREESCKHHACHIPLGRYEIEWLECNPFGARSYFRCPYYKTKAQMIAKNRRAGNGW